MLSPLCNESPPWSHVEARNVHRLLQSEGGACVCILVCLKHIRNKALKEHHLDTLAQLQPPLRLSDSLPVILAEEQYSNPALIRTGAELRLPAQRSWKRLNCQRSRVSWWREARGREWKWSHWTQQCRKKDHESRRWSNYKSCWKDSSILIKVM